MNLIDRSRCYSCGSAEVTTHWVLPGSQCQPCADIKQAKINADRKAREEKEFAAYKAHAFRREEDGQCPDDGEVCNECCEHEYDASEGFMCLNCGNEGAEEMMSMAEDRAKDLRKYGAV